MKKLEVKTTGTVIYLYLLSASDASTREKKSIRVIEDKAPSLPPRDYRTNDDTVAPPLNARSHRYATVPSNLDRASDVQRRIADFCIPQQEEFPIQAPATDRIYGQQQAQVPLVPPAVLPVKDPPPPIPRPLLETQG